MPPSSTFQFGPYTFVSVPLFIVGLLGTYYLVQYKEKSAATWFMTAILASFAYSMVAMFCTTALVLWGGAFWPAQDAAVITCMAAVIGFLYYHPAWDHHPQGQHSTEARLAIGFGVGAAALANGYSVWYAYQILVRHSFDLGLHPYYPFLMGFVILVTLALAMRRTIVVHNVAVELAGEDSERRSRAARIGEALLRPQKLAQPHRNLCLALALGLSQAVGSALGMSGVITAPLEVLIIGLSLLALSVVLVYTSWDHVTRQPGLIVKLIGLSLVTILAILGVVGLYAIHSAAARSDETRLLETEVVRRAIQANDLSGLPDSVIYVISLGSTSAGETDAPQIQMLYLRGDQENPQPLLDEIKMRLTAGSSQIWAPRTTWGTYFEWYVKAAHSADRVSLYFGSHPQGSYYQYVGYPIVIGDNRYEAGFSIMESNTPVHQRAAGMIAIILISSLLVLYIFPLVFRASILTPLDHLLRGVHQANAGDLSVHVPISNDDEIGFLAGSFNDMVASLKAQIAVREEKEEALRKLTATLEDRIFRRTRELAVLYEVSAAASRAKDIESLLRHSLLQAIGALDADMGAIFLFEENADSSSAPQIRLSAHHGLPAQWQRMEMLLPPDENSRKRLTEISEPVLINDLSTAHDVPQIMREMAASSLLMAPIRTEDQALGALWVIHQPGSSFSAEDVALLASIADQVAVAVHSDSLRKRAVVLEERQRLARELHDSVTQLLYGLVSLAEAGQARLEAGMPDTAKPTFNRIAKTARQALNEMRLFVYRLRPLELEQQGLVSAINERLAVVEGWSGVRVSLQADEHLQLPLQVEAALYQIVQEALNNMLKHAHASRGTIHLHRREQGLVLEIADDGCGFDPRDTGGRGLGLRHLSERARSVGGQLEIHSNPGEGTRVSVYIPETALNLSQ